MLPKMIQVKLSWGPPRMEAAIPIAAKMRGKDVATTDTAARRQHKPRACARTAGTCSPVRDRVYQRDVRARQCQPSVTRRAVTMTAPSTSRKSVSLSPELVIDSTDKHVDLPFDAEPVAVGPKNGRI